MSYMPCAANRMTLGARPVQAARVGQVFLQCPARTVASRSSVVVQAAQNSLRRQRVSERNRLYNKHYMDLVASSSRQAIKGYKNLLLKAKEISEEAQLGDVDKLTSIAFSNIDKAVVKGVLHRNTGGRRKAKITRVRKAVLSASGLYVPA